MIMSTLINDLLLFELHDQKIHLDLAKGFFFFIEHYLNFEMSCAGDGWQILGYGIAIIRSGRGSLKPRHDMYTFG
jgi:hypothetical protein